MTEPAKSDASPPVPDAGSRPCPICGRPATVAARPFCSKRCADVDLHRWLGGTYRVPDDGPRPEDADPSDA